MRPRNVLDFLVYVAVRIFVCMVQAMPLDTCARWSRHLAALCADVLKIRQDVIEDNLIHAFPDMSAAQRRDLSRRMWEHLFLMIVEVVHTPRKVHRTNWRDYITLHNADWLIRAFFDDRPTVLICGHYGNFEFAGYAMGILGFPTYTIARPLDNPYLNRYLNEFRGATGQYILSKTGTSQQVEDILNRGGILSLLGDQHAGPRGCWVEFFGRPASSHKAIALFTLGSQAPTIFCYTRRTGRPLHHLMATDSMIDPHDLPKEMQSVPAITQWYTQQLEHTIRQAPDQYWWLHRRWKDGRPLRKSPRQSQAA